MSRRLIPLYATPRLRSRLADRARTAHARGGSHSARVVLAAARQRANVLPMSPEASRCRALLYPS